MEDYELLQNFPDNPQPLYIRRSDAQKWFGISPRQLENLAMERKGPPFFRVGKFAIYSVSDFIKWLTSNPVMTNNE